MISQLCALSLKNILLGQGSYGNPNNKVFHARKEASDHHALGAVLLVL